MASMIAKACSSTQIPAMTVQEKGSRNKRKFRADPPLVDHMKANPSPLNECASFEFSAEKFDGHGHSNRCDMCCLNQDNSDLLKLDLGLSCAMAASEVQPREDMDASADDYHDADWSDLTESELEEIVLRNLDTIFRSAIKKIAANGYSEDVATKAILQPGLWYGCKDTVSNLVENTLAFLSSGQEIGPSVDHPFEDLQQMEKYILAELVCLLREVRPFFSTGDAMWCLLIFDMHISHACAMDGDSFGSFLSDRTSEINPPLAAPSLSMDTKVSDLKTAAVPFKTNAHASSFPSAQSNLASVQGGHNFQSEALKTAGGSNLAPKTSRDSNGQAPEKESQNFSPSINEKTFSVGGLSHTTGADEKSVSCRKVSGIAKRDHILRQKSLHFEKHYRSYGSKSSFRSSSKISCFGGLMLDKKLKGVAESTGLNSKTAPFSINKGVGSNAPQENDNHIVPATVGSSAAPTFGLDIIEQNSSLHTPSISSNSTLLPVKSSPSLPSADTELSLSFPAKSADDAMPVGYNVEVPNTGFLSSSDDKSLRQWLSHDREAVIMKLIPRARALQDQLQEWTEWANQKIMQAARRLSMDKAELKTLRQEKEEVERLKKEKLSLEENTLKKLSEMKNALCKASGQVDRANAAVNRLEVENVALRREMENSKLYAAKSAANCHEVLEREKKILMEIQSWEKQKKIFQEELSAENMKLMHLQQILVLAKNTQAQIEGKLNQEQKMKDDLLTQISQVKKEREQIEASTRSKEEAIKSTAESNLQKYKEDIERLEKEISLLRLRTDSSKIAELRRGIDGSYSTKVAYSKDTPSLKDSALSNVSRPVTSTYSHSQDMSSVKRERECVMCLSEEMSVVFLPCAHQVVCTMCNELHEKKGMQYCPSCRSPIERRVCVRYAVS